MKDLYLSKDIISLNDNSGFVKWGKLVEDAKCDKNDIRTLRTYLHNMAIINGSFASDPFSSGMTLCRVT